MSFLDDAERALEKAVDRDSWNRDFKLYVSDLKHALPAEGGGDCARKLWAKLRDEPQDPLTPGVQLMFKAGDMMHDQIAEWLEEHMPDKWELVGVEERARENIEPLRGRYDQLWENTETGEMMVVDVKSKRGGSFRYLKVDGPKPGDVLQVQAYMMSTHAQKGALLYVDREGQNWVLMFEVERDDETVQEAIDELVRIRDAAQAGDPVATLEPVLKRRDNKGPDSIKVEWPWQVEWCPLEECHCQARATGRLPDGIIGYVNNDGTLDLKDEYEGLRPWVESKLEEE